MVPVDYGYSRYLIGASILIIAILSIFKDLYVVIGLIAAVFVGLLVFLHYKLK